MGGSRCYPPNPEFAMQRLSIRKAARVMSRSCTLSCTMLAKEEEDERGEQPLNNLMFLPGPLDCSRKTTRSCCFQGSRQRQATLLKHTQPRLNHFGSKHISINVNKRDTPYCYCSFYSLPSNPKGNSRICKLLTLSGS